MFSIIMFRIRGERGRGVATDTPRSTSEVPTVKLARCFASARLRQRNKTQCGSPAALSSSPPPLGTADRGRCPRGSDRRRSGRGGDRAHGATSKFGVRTAVNTLEPSANFQETRAGCVHAGAHQLMAPLISPVGSWSVACKNKKKKGRKKKSGCQPHFPPAVCGTPVVGGSLQFLAAAME